ncbi:MAG TPA: hypothetical protein VGL62_13185 [Vicinamibacterales bacterium]
MRLAFALALAVSGMTAAAPSHARATSAREWQQPKRTPMGTGKLPDAWKLRFDDPSAKPNEVVVEQKKDALVVTSGPAAIYYKASMRASGDYDLSAVVSQIKTTERPEGYGLFIAGADLTKPDGRATLFLVRQDGMYSIRGETGSGDTKAIIDWSVARPIHEPSGMKTSNTLAIRARGNELSFLIDGTEVHHLTRAEAGGDGIAGIRVGQDLQVQVTKLTLKKQ